MCPLIAVVYGCLTQFDKLSYFLCGTSEKVYLPFAATAAAAIVFLPSAIEDGMFFPSAAAVMDAHECSEGMVE